MIKVVIHWTDVRSDGHFTTNEAEVSMPTLPRIGETVHIVGVVSRKVERIVHRLDHTWATEIVVSLGTGVATKG